MSVAVRELQSLFEMGSLGGLSDGQLLDRFVDRREEAVFEAIVHRHGSMVWGVCRRVLRDYHDAEDAFQATFLVLARKAASIAHREKLGNWLYGVAHQTAMKARSQRAKRRGREGQVPDMPQPVAVPNDRRDDLAECLDRVLSRLPEKYRIPVVLCDLEGMTHREAADQLEWPVGTLSSRLSRARALLARRLSRPGMTLSGGSLAVLLAPELASASMPTRLIGPTARAASLYVAGKAATAGAVSARVAALTGEVMKMVLLSKIKVTTAMVLVVSALAVGGTGLAYRAQAEDPSQEEQVTTQKSDRKHLQAASGEPMLAPNSTPTPSISINGHDGHRVRIAILGLGKKREIELQALADGQLRTNTGNGDDSITTRGMVLKLPIDQQQADLKKQIEELRNEVKRLRGLLAELKVGEAGLRSLRP